MNSLCEQTYILIQLLYVYVIIVELKRCLVFVLRITQRKSDVKTDLSTVTLKMKLDFDIMKLNHSTTFDQSNLMPEAVLCSRKSVFFFLSVSVLYLALISLSQFQCQNYHRCIYDRGTDRFAEFSRSLLVESGY